MRLPTTCSSYPLFNPPTPIAKSCKHFLPLDLLYCGWTQNAAGSDQIKSKMFRYQGKINFLLCTADLAR